MIQLQVRDQGSDAWRKVHDFPQICAAQIDSVQHSRLAARLVDLATETVLARSLPARGIPVDKVPEGIIREFVLTFQPPEAVHQKAPDPNRKHATRVVVQRPVHQAFARDGY